MVRKTASHGRTFAVQVYPREENPPRLSRDADVPDCDPAVAVDDLGPDRGLIEAGEAIQGMEGVTFGVAVMGMVIAGAVLPVGLLAVVAWRTFRSRKQRPLRVPEPQ